MPKYRFSEIAINITDKRMPTPEDKELYIAPNNLDTDTLSVPEYGYKVDLTGTKLIMHKGDMLFGRREPQLKKAAIAPHDGLFSAHGMIFHPNEKLITKEFFPFFISSDYFFDAAIRISVGSLSPTVNWKDLKDLEFTIPNLSEQREYEKILWAIIQTKKTYKDLIYKTDELVKSQFIEMFGLPEVNDHEYEIGQIGDVVCDVHYGTSKKASEDGEYTYLRMNNITYSGTLDLSEVKRITVPDKELSGCIVKKGDVLFNRTNSKELVGKTCAFNLDEPMIIAGYIIRLRMNGRVLPEYLSTYLNLDSSKKMLMTMSKGAVGQANINAQEVQSISIVIPPMEKQMQFHMLIEQSDKSKFAIQQSLKDLNQMQKALVKRIFE